MENSALHNPHLEGDPFLWEGGDVGVLLAHGFTATPAEVRLLGRRLHERGYTIAGPLLAGHGTIPEDLNQTRWQDWVQACEKAYQQLVARCKHVFIGGESTGAIIALYLASEHPEAAAVLAYAPAIKLTLRTSDLIRLYLAAPFLTSVPKEDIDSNENWQGYPVNPLKGTIQLLRLQRQVRRRLPRIRQPVLIFQGRLDTTVHPSAGELILQGISSTVKELHWMEHSHHVIILDRELDQVTEITLAFMEQVLRG